MGKRKSVEQLQNEIDKLTSLQAIRKAKAALDELRIEHRKKYASTKKK